MTLPRPLGPAQEVSVIEEPSEGSGPTAVQSSQSRVCALRPGAAGGLVEKKRKLDLSPESRDQLTGTLRSV